MMRASLCAVLILVLTAFAIYVHAQSTYIPRHTPGFPTIINESIVRDILRSLFSNTTLLRELQTVLSSVNTTSLLNTSSSTTSARPNLVENVTRPSYPPITGLAGGNLSSMLRALESYRGSSRGFLELLKKVAQYLQRGGGASPSTYINVINAIRSAAYRVGGTKLYIDALKYLLSHAPSNMSFFTLPNTSIPIVASSVAGSSAPQPVAPQLSTPTLSSFTRLLLPIAIAIAAAILAYVLARTGLLSRVRMVLASRVAPSFVAMGLGRIRSEIVELYWRAVNAVSRSTGVDIAPNETHREYLARVKRLLGSAASAFEELTLVYEVHRFGHVVSSELVERARRAFERVVRRP